MVCVFQSKRLLICDAYFDWLLQIPYFVKICSIFSPEILYCPASVWNNCLLSLLHSYHPGISHCCSSVLNCLYRQSHIYIFNFRLFLDHAGAHQRVASKVCKCDTFIEFLSVQTSLILLLPVIINLISYIILVENYVLSEFFVIGLVTFLFAQLKMRLTPSCTMPGVDECQVIALCPIHSEKKYPAFCLKDWNLYMKGGLRVAEVLTLQV